MDYLFIDIFHLKEIVFSELDKRRSRISRFRYSNIRGGKPELYGTTAAVNIYVVLGIPLGSLWTRRKWANVIRSYRRRDGSFSGNAPEHALCMAIQAFNLLGAEIPKNVTPLAPLDVDSLTTWLEKKNWNSTHKDIWGATTPLLADGLVSPIWVETFVNNLTARLSPNNPKNTWCSSEAPSKKVISAMYHILQSFDAGGLPYPYPELLINRLLNLDWHKKRQQEEMTLCTDGDWGWMLMELCKLKPMYFEKAITQIKSVSKQRMYEWNHQVIDISALSTHHIYCYLWVTALFQHLDRSIFRGPWLHDTLNSPHLFRLGNKRYDFKS